MVGELSMQVESDYTPEVSMEGGVDQNAGYGESAVATASSHGGDARRWDAMAAELRQSQIQEGEKERKINFK